MEVTAAVNRLPNRDERCPRVQFKLFGKSTSMVLDTGTNLNIISKRTYMNLPNKPKLRPTLVNAYGFNAKQPIPIIGEFKVRLRANYKRIDAKFLVLDGNADNLMGFEVASKLGLVKLVEVPVHQEYERPYKLQNYNSDKDIYHINTVRASEFNPRVDYPNLFKGQIGRLKDIEVLIATDPTIRPIQVPPYPIPLPLMDMTKEKVMKMWDDGIIEPVEGKLTWLSPMHVVPKIDPVTKTTVGVRITSNNKALNKALILEKRWMPSIKTLTHELNGMVCFSKIDLKDAFNQVIIDRSCRNLTAFSTPWGTFRYCRLNMGLSIASELFQSILTDILQHIPQQKLATDDIIVYGKDFDDCKRITVMVLEALSKAEATLSADKCEFMKSEITFFGHTISAKGLKQLECKVKDFIETGEPRNHKELHSF